MKDKDILEALRVRAAQILIANGYHTDAGARVLQGKVFDTQTDTLPAIVITQPEDDADYVDDDETSTEPQMVSTFVLEGWREVDQANPLPDLMDLREDLLRACYRPTPDLPDTLGGIVSAMRLDSTTKLMPAPGASIGMAQVVLRVEYHETFGD